MYAFQQTKQQFAIVAQIAEKGEETADNTLCRQVDNTIPLGGGKIAGYLVQAERYSNLFGKLVVFCIWVPKDDLNKHMW